MSGAADKYKEFLLLLQDSWRIKPEDLDKLLGGTLSLSREGMSSWSQAAYLFNRESRALLKETAQKAQGFKIIFADATPKTNLSTVKRALLYSDLIVVFSGSASHGNLSDVFGPGLRKGGVVCDGVLEWFHDLFTLKPLLLSGYGLCIQKHFFDLFPENQGPRWVLSDMVNRGNRTTLKEGYSASVDPMSAYFDMLSPSSFECTFSGTDFSDWKGKLMATFKSVHDASFATLINVDLPYLENVPLDVLVEIRQEESETFEAFRVGLMNAVREAMRFDVGSYPMEEFAIHIQKTYIDPEVERVREKLREVTGMKAVRAFNPVITTMSLIFNALVGNPLGVLIDALQAGNWGIQEFFQRRKDSTQPDQKNEMYLLWKIKKMAKEKKA
jgi:hypothetical protein